nr:hypothetical protein [Micromonospora purpureochromogenes]
MANQVPADFWGSGKIIRAKILAEILMHGPSQDPGHPPRLILAGARITGKLDLGCANVRPFYFQRCIFDEQPLMNDATAEFIGFTSCVLPGLSAVRAVSNGPVLVTLCKVTGQVDFEDARIAGDASFAGTTFDVPSSGYMIDLSGADIGSDLLCDRISGNQAIHLHNATVGGDIRLSGARISCGKNYALLAKQVKVGGSVVCSNDFSCEGVIHLEGARIDGQLLLPKARLSQPNGMCLDIDHAVIGLGMRCEDTHFVGSVRMHHAQIGCQLSFDRARISDCGTDALLADHSTIDGSGHFRQFRADGAVHFHGARFECNLLIDKAKIASESGPALTLDGTLIGANLSIGGSEVKGSILLVAATIQGALSLRDTQISPHVLWAVDARRSEIRGGVIAAKGFKASGSVSFANAKINVVLNLAEAAIASPRHHALIAAGLMLDGDLIADRAKIEGLLDVTAASVTGNVRLADAELIGVPLEESSGGREVDQLRRGDWRGVSLRATASIIHGDVDLRGARLRQSLVLESASVQRSVLLDGSTLEVQESMAVRADGMKAAMLSLRLKDAPTSGISLAAAGVGTLRDDKNSWPANAPVALEGFTYGLLDTTLTVADRLKLLEHATPTYSPHPYEQLASNLTASGQDDDANIVRLASIRRSHASSRALIRVWGRLQDFVVGYGFLPMRALAIFLALFVGASIWFTFTPYSCDAPGSSNLPLCPIKASEHPTWDPWLYTLDLLIPLVDLGHGNAWDPTGISKAVMYVLVVGGWVLTTTIVAAAGRSLRGKV